MPAYVIINVDVKDQEQYAQYMKRGAPTILQYGGKPLVRGGAIEKWEGSPQPKRIIVIEFGSMEKARTWWNSPEYRAAKKYRENAAEADVFCVEGF
jgi:uncharacterized protein (DUF1330 family)